ncbi:Sda1 protein [Saccharomycopsis crataegensis]|uniref:Protein SDA1 n=1 Tax=Saccharomycopsis crataegensis TaxID=43959 RepID=A0AAV5QIZ3_9ASCO|nr:Sda1 protein [Saccharomycopsis crataegensis]
MARKQRAALLPTNIILLQNLVKRDPLSYREEFLQQYAHYESLRDILMASSSSIKENGIDEELRELIGFITAVCPCYKEETKQFPGELKTLLSEHHRDLNPELREKIIQCLVMLRNRDIISAESLIQTIFPLLTEYSAVNNNTETNSKALRKQIFHTLVTLLKSLNSGTRAARLNKTVQNLFLSGLTKENALFVTKITIKLWYSQIWNDSRTVEIMVQSTLSGDAKVSVAGARFFLGADKDLYEEGNDDSDDEVDISQLKHHMKINKKTKKQSKKFDSAVKTIKKKQNKDPNKGTALNFTAVQLLRDPQGFAENLFKQLATTSARKFNMEQKIIFMNLISRIVGVNKLQLLGLYSYFLKYLTPKQQDVTKILAACAQSSHDLVPPDAINMVVRKIADEFVSDGVSTEVCSAGMNSIREILTRAPLAIDQALLQDLTAYSKSKAKAVNIAAKSLISLYREVAPEMLMRKDRGKEASIKLQGSKKGKSLQFGVESSVQGIPGIELLDKWREEQGLAVDDENEEAAWEEQQKDLSDADDIDGDWVTVESDKEYEISDGDDDKEDEDEKMADADVNDDSDSDLDLSDDDESKNFAKTKKNKTISRKAKKKRREIQEAEEKKYNGDAEESFKKLAANRILTPADFAKLEELKMEAGVEKLMGIKSSIRNEEEVDADGLVGPVKRKQTKEERIESIREGREGREKFGSRRGKIATPHSTTNREKARKKNFIMMIHKRQVQGKARRSLRDKQKVLQAHIEKQKKKGY